VIFLNISKNSLFLKVFANLFAHTEQQFTVQSLQRKGKEEGGKRKKKGKKEGKREEERR
jgi:hypothetical protein